MSEHSLSHRLHRATIRALGDMLGFAAPAHAYPVADAAGIAERAWAGTGRSLRAALDSTSADRAPRSSGHR